MARELLLDTHGKAAAIPGTDKKLVRNPSLWRSVPEDPNNPFYVIATVYREKTGRVYTRPTISSTEDSAYQDVHTHDPEIMASLNTIMTSPELGVIIASQEMDPSRKRLETSVLAKRQVHLDNLAYLRRK